MSLEKPSRKVEWTDNWTNWNDVSDDVMSFDVTAEDLALGPWSFLLTLSNKEGKYGSVFPSVDTEKGLHLGFRFTINDKVLGLFRASDIIPWFDPSPTGGDQLKVSGLGLGYEGFRRLCIMDQYPRYMADQIIYDQNSKIGFNDITVSTGPFFASRWTIVIPHSGKPYFNNLIVELETNLDYSAFFDSTQKPAPLSFFPKADSTKRLNTVLQSILFDQGNNILWGREHRTTKTIKNYLTFHRYKGEVINFNTFVPNDQDAWTEDVLNTFGQHWGVTVGILQADKVTFYEGTASIKCYATGAYGKGPDFWMIPANSMYGIPFNPDNEGVNQIYFQLRKHESDESTPVQPRILLYDDASPEHIIYLNFPIDPDTWTQCGAPVGFGHWSSWYGDTANFNGNIAKIEFQDAEDHTSQGTYTLWVDRLYFANSSGYNDTYLEDSASVAKFGKWEDEVTIPYAYPFFNSKLWGDKLLARLSQPNRVLQLHTLLDPALVMKNDNVTPASLLPGWQLQVNIPRYGILPVASGGVWWRILRTIYHWSEVVFIVEFYLQSTAAESPDDFSFLDTARLAGLTDPIQYRIIKFQDELKKKSRQLSTLPWTW